MPTSRVVNESVPVGRSGLVKVTGDVRKRRSGAPCRVVGRPLAWDPESVQFAWNDDIENDNITGFSVVRVEPLSEPISSLARCSRPTPVVEGPSKQSPT